MQPLVSVVVPCYNAGKYIAECLTSIANQDYPNIEIIVIDDGSTDDSRKHIKVDLGVQLLCFSHNQGECIASQTGFELAKGEFICRLSADDTFVAHDHITRQVEEMQRYNLDWCYNSMTFFGPSIWRSELVRSGWFPIPLRLGAAWAWPLDNLILKFPYVCYLINTFRSPVCSSATMIRASTFRSGLTWYNDFETICDYTLLGQMFLRHLRCRAIHRADTFYRVYPAQSTTRLDTKMMQKKVTGRMWREATQPKYPLWMRLTAYVLLKVFSPTS